MRTAIFSPAKNPISWFFLAACCLFLLGPHADEFVRFQTRFAIFAKEMLVHGISFFPTVYDEPYPDYPATSTLFIVAIAKLLGKLTPFTAIIPSALAAAGSVAFTYAIGALYSKRLGTYGALFLLLTAMFFTQGRTISLDAYVTFVTTACFYFVVSSDRLQTTHRLIWIYPLLLLGFACRGPIGLVAPTGVICSYYLLTQNWRRFWSTGLVATGLLALSISILLLAAYHTGGKSFIQDVLRMEVVGRLSDNSNNDGYSYYFVSGLGNYAITFPLVLLVCASQWRKLITPTTDPHIHLLRALLAWTLIVLVGYSIPACKRYYYVLSISPAIALIVAYFWTEAELTPVFQKIRALITQLLKLLPGLLACTLTGLYLSRYSLPPAYYLTAITLLVSLQLGSLIWIRHNTQLPHSVPILIIAVLAFASVHILLIEPINLDINRTRDFVLAVEQQRLTQQGDLIFYNIGKDGLDLKYIVNVPVDSVHPIFINQPDELKNYPQAVFITRPEFFQALPAAVRNQFSMIQPGMLGHNKVIAFKARTKT